MPKATTSNLMEEKVCQFRKKFDFVADIQLEILGEDEWIIDGMATRVTIHKESLNTRLRLSILPVDLLWWYQLHLA